MEYEITPAGAKLVKLVVTAWRKSLGSSPVNTTNFIHSLFRFIDACSPYEVECPLCGSDMEIMQGRVGDKWYVACGSKRCLLRYSAGYDTKDLLLEELERLKRRQSKELPAYDKSLSMVEGFGSLGVFLQPTGTQKDNPFVTTEKESEVENLGGVRYWVKKSIEHNNKTISALQNAEKYAGDNPQLITYEIRAFRKRDLALTGLKNHLESIQNEGE